MCHDHLSFAPIMSVTKQCTSINHCIYDLSIVATDGLQTLHTSFSLREGCRQTLRSADQPPDVSSLHTLPRFSEVFPPTSQLQNPQSRRTRNHHILELCDECTVAHVPSAVIIPRGPASCLRERELSVAFVVLLGLQSRVRNGWGRQTCIGLPEGRQKAPQNLHHQIVDV